MRWAAVVGILLCTHAATAAPTILLVETRGAPTLSTLPAQVELHVGARATVTTRIDRDTDPLTFAETASALVADGTATIVVWTAPVNGGYLVFASTPTRGRALMELVFVDAAIAPAELERTIALKVAGLFDAVRSMPAPLATRRTWRIEVSGGFAHESRARATDGRSALAFGVGWQRDGWSLAPAIGAHWQPSGTSVAMSGRASLTELGAVASLEGARVFDHLQLFVRPRIALATLLARGDSTDGRHGTATVLSPYAGGQIGARVALSHTAWLGLAAGIDGAWVRHRLTVDDETVIDLGRFRFDVGLALLVAL